VVRSRGPGRRPGWRVVVVVVCAAVGVVLGGAAAPVEAGPPWAWPLEGAGPAAVVRRFDPPATRYGSGHRGVDLASAPGVPVLAAGPGRVSYAGLLAGRGVVVVVHGDLRTTYEPVTASVPVGAQVAAGAPIGHLAAGHAGCAAPACLHWGLRRGEEYLDPLGLLRAGPVRLLPPGGGAPVGGSGGARGAAPVPGRAPVRAGPPVPPSVPVDRAPAVPSRGPSPRSGAAEERSGWGPLRALASPEGGLAALGLLAGLRLLHRPRRPPRGPAGGASGSPGPVPPTDALAARRSGVAAPEEVPDAVGPVRRAA
jgi:murein DD-endopeptidase MepM/ murein hydrolase activator NlpD